MRKEYLGFYTEVFCNINKGHTSLRKYLRKMNNNINAEVYTYRQKKLYRHEAIGHKFKVGWMS